MALSTLRHSEVVAEEMKKIYVENGCWYNASVNLPKLEAKYDRKMKVVVGSASFILKNGDLSICGINDDQRHTFFLREKLKNPKITYEEIWAMIKKEVLRGSLPNLSRSELKKEYTNSHGWVEDEYGNVWDYVFKEGETIKPGFINGVHRSKLAEMGYVLKAFDEEDQKFVLKSVYSSTIKSIESLKSKPPEFPKKKVILLYHEALKQVLGY
jgi:hypothetical protein